MKPAFDVRPLVADKGHVDIRRDNPFHGGFDIVTPPYGPHVQVIGHYHAFVSHPIPQQPPGNPDRQTGWPFIVQIAVENVGEHDAGHMVGDGRFKRGKIS